MNKLNLKEIMEIAEKIQIETYYSDFLNEEELAKVGVELVNVGGEGFGLLGNLVLTHVDSGMTAQEIVNMAFDVKEYVDAETKEYKEKIKELESELIKHKEDELFLGRAFRKLVEEKIAPNYQ